MKHLISTKELSDEDINKLLSDAKDFKEKKEFSFKNKLIVTMFFENSTRTRSSFEIAAKRLNIQVVHLDPSKSSTKKGESLEDTFENLAAMDPDAIVIRHEDNQTPYNLSKTNKIPIINAGAGNSSHPSQALLDLMTIKEHFTEIKGKTVGIIGDIKNSRVASSDIELLTRMGLNIVLIAPKEYMPDSDLPQYENIKDIIDELDIIISLRAQLERHKEPIYESNNSYCITSELIKDKAVLILHPGPVMRNIDITDEVLEDKRCKVLTQVNNGLYMRMAIIKMILEGKNL